MKSLTTILVAAGLLCACQRTPSSSSPAAGTPSGSPAARTEARPATAPAPSAAPAPSTAPAPSAAPAAAAPVASDGPECQSAADCEIVTGDCCDCESVGGSVHAIGHSRRAEWFAALRSRCAGAACAEGKSRDPSCGKTAACRNAHCVLE